MLIFQPNVIKSSQMGQEKAANLATLSVRPRTLPSA